MQNTKLIPESSPLRIQYLPAREGQRRCESQQGDGAEHHGWNNSVSNPRRHRQSYADTIVDRYIWRIMLPYLCCFDVRNNISPPHFFGSGANCDSLHHAFTPLLFRWVERTTQVGRKNQRVNGSVRIREREFFLQYFICFHSLSLHAGDDDACAWIRATRSLHADAHRLHFIREQQPGKEGKSEEREEWPDFILDNPVFLSLLLSSLSCMHSPALSEQCRFSLNSTSTVEDSSTLSQAALQR